MPSLKDQLLKAGVADAKKAKQIEKEKRKQARQSKGGLATPVNEAKIAAEKAKAEQLAKTQAANKQRQQAAEEKAIAAQIKQLVESNRIDHSNGEIGYQFVHNKKIKRLYVDAKQQRQLEIGLLSIVSLGEQYELIPAAAAEKIRQRSEDTVVLLNEKGNDISSEDDDEYYAQFKVPDDLMW